MTARIDPDSELAQFLLKDADMQQAIQRREAQSHLEVAKLQHRVSIKQLQVNIALQALALVANGTSNPVSKDVATRANEVLLLSLSDDFYALPESES